MNAAKFHGDGSINGMSDLVIFGAGVNAKIQYEWAVLCRYTVLFFVDNDPDKWGSTICGIEVSPVQRLVSLQCKVLVGKKYWNEMVQQLREQSFKGKVISLEDAIKESVIQGRRSISSGASIQKKPIAYVIDSYFYKSTWGGTERWSCSVANALKAHKHPVAVLCGDNPRFDQEMDPCIHFKGVRDIDVVKDMVDELQKRLPCVAIVRPSPALYAALIVLGRFPQQIKIVLVVHGTDPKVYEFEKIAYWTDQLDAVICISREIEAVLRYEYKLPSQKLIYRMNPIPLPKNVVRSKQSDRLKIAFAARLDITQKRTDLLPKVIDMCLSKGLDVEFNIAGEGDCSELLERYVALYHLEDRVHLLGWIPPDEMESFWMEQDIYLNLSAYEGMSLAMLEAMACGVVPVVTDVSGVRDLIEDGKNGLIVPVDQWERISEKISIAYRDREWLKRASAYNIELVREKCDIEQYANWIEQTFRLDESD